jgi:hypothetical protein
VLRGFDVRRDIDGTPEEVRELMDIAEAKAKLEAVLDELAEAGFSVWGWDDESIQIAHLNEPSAACAPRHVSRIDM